MKEKIIGFLLLCGMMTLFSVAGAVTPPYSICDKLETERGKTHCREAIDEIKRKNGLLPTYRLKCARVYNGLYPIRRCENEEVVCYRSDGQGTALQCKFKEK